MEKTIEELVIVFSAAYFVLALIVIFAIAGVESQLEKLRKGVEKLRDNRGL